MPIQAAFTLNPNEIFASLGNMIISQEVFADNLGAHQTLVEKARVDGSMYGDKKLYYATDVLVSHPWGADAEAANLLSLDRPADPEVQDITLDVFRQIRLTVDNYLSKRAWSTEGAFSSFQSVMLGWIRETKRVYDGTLYNVFIGTDETSIGSQQQTVDLGTIASDSSLNTIEKAELSAMEVARKLADLFVEMSDYSRAFNDYGYLRSYAGESIKVIWNSDFVNKIKKVDLPTIFHKEGLVEKFEQEVLPAKYFGQVQASAHTSVAGERAVGELVIGTAHYFPGDVIATGSSVGAGESYIVDPDVICKVLVKLPPMMSAFEVGTSFFNPRSLTENHYLTFGHNTLQHLKNYPLITVKAI